MPERVAIYPGSFDPPTLGHYDIIVRAAKLFDRIIVTVARNEAKQGLFSIEERLEMLRELSAGIPNVDVDQFQCLTIEYARTHGALSIIRGLRVMSDFEMELSLAINNHKLAPEIDTVCLMSSEPYLFLSSRQVKEIAGFGGKIDHYVTPEIERRIRAKFA